MLRKLFKKISWKHALGEILFIFIGITMAIWFNNWNEAKKEQKVEIKSLAELKEAITQDLVDINENIAGFRERVNLYRILLKHIEEDLPMTDSLKSRLPYLQGLTTFLSNIGPYETLKSRGLETIRNDSIRLKISLYYDVEYERIQTNEKQHHSHYNEYLKPQLLKKFDLSTPYISPIDYEVLLEDFDFKQIIYWALRTDSYMLVSYQDLEKKGKILVENLGKEIKRLQ